MAVAGNREVAIEAQLPEVQEVDTCQTTTKHSNELKYGMGTALTDALH